MSFHYTVSISTGLRTALAPVDVSLLDYLFNAASEIPVVDDGDELRSNALALKWLRQYRQTGSGADSACMADIARMPDGRILSCHLFLFSPGNKLEGIFEEWLALLRWLASLITVDGHFATVSLEDGGGRQPFLFYAIEGRLFMNMAEKTCVVHSTDSDEKREFSGV